MRAIFSASSGTTARGRATLLLALAGLKKPDRGTLMFRSTPLDFTGSMPGYRKHLSMVFQEPLLLNATVFAAGALRHSAPERPIGPDTFRGGGPENKPCPGLRRISPEILFLDEPFASLDPPTREAIVADLEKVLAETKTTTVMATHDRNEALRLSDRIAIMESGRIAQIDRPAVIMNEPVDEFVASFVGTESILEGEVRR